jgi:hypothetical protein
VTGTAAAVLTLTATASGVVAAPRDITLALSVGSDRWARFVGSDRWATQVGFDRFSTQV